MAELDLKRPAVALGNAREVQDLGRIEPTGQHIGQKLGNTGTYRHNAAFISGLNFLGLICVLPS